MYANLIFMLQTNILSLWLLWKTQTFILLSSLLAYNEILVFGMKEATTNKALTLGSRNKLKDNFKPLN